MILLIITMSMATLPVESAKKIDFSNYVQYNVKKAGGT